MYCILSRSEVCNLGSFNILKFQSQNEMLITSRSSQKVLFSAKVIVFLFKNVDFCCEGRKFKRVRDLIDSVS